MTKIKVQREFGGSTGHTFDLTSLGSNVLKDRFGNSLSRFTPALSPVSAGVNVFAQDLATFGSLMQCPYIFPTPVLVGPGLRYLQSMKQACTIAVLDSYPRKYWWPLLHHYAKKAFIKNSFYWRWDGDELLIPSAQGWTPHPGIPAIFGHHQSWLSFKRRSFYEPGLIPFVGILFLLRSIPVRISPIISVLFGRSSLWWQSCSYPLYAVLSVVMPMIVTSGFANTVVTRERSYPQ